MKHKLYLSLKNECAVTIFFDDLKPDQVEGFKMAENNGIRVLEIEEVKEETKVEQN